MTEELDNALDASLADEVMLEEGSGEDHDTVGLELDARQATEIRQIFLTTLPDYVEPVRQMFDQLTASDGGDAELKKTLSKTLSSISMAAARVGIADVERELERLREDAMLLGDASEPQEPLRDRIAASLALLTELAGGSEASAAERSETIVAAFRSIEGVDPSALEKLVAAGVVYVDQLLQADRGEIAAVSGLDAASVEHIVAALSGKVADDDPAASPEDDPVRAEPSASDDLQELVAAQAAGELALDETRGELLRKRLQLRAMREELSAAEERRDELRATLATVKRTLSERLSEVADAEAHKTRLDLEDASTRAELERTSARLQELQSERRTVADEHGRLAREVASLSQRVDQVLRGHLSS